MAYAVETLGKELSLHFPRTNVDKKEFPNKVINMSKQNPPPNYLYASPNEKSPIKWSFSDVPLDDECVIYSLVYSCIEDKDTKGNWITIKEDGSNLPSAVLGFYRVTYLRSPTLLFWKKPYSCSCWAFLTDNGRWLYSDGHTYSGWYLDTIAVTQYWSIPHIPNVPPKIPRPKESYTK